MHLYPNQNLTMSNIHVETDRLYLRDFEKKDAKALFEMDSIPEIHTYLERKPLTQLKQAEEVIEWLRFQYKEYGIGRWACFLKENDAFIGWCGLKIEKEFRLFTYNDLGYRFHPQFWGKGYGYESAFACMNYAFYQLGWKKLNATADVRNIASNKILQKLGFTQTEQFKHREDLCNWYEKTVS